MKTLFNTWLAEEKNKLDLNRALKLDLHCHDYNSDVPDELWGRLLNAPETWLATEELFKLQVDRGLNVNTVTNHNNARSCWEQLDKGNDVLVGAEFTCHFKEYNIWLHVLTYGFTPAQEIKLNKLRKNLYQFMAYCAEENIPTILPHPLFFYSSTGQPPLEMFEKLSILFERFEVLNGQRDLRQNLMTWSWIKSLDEERLELYEQKHNLNQSEFCKIPNLKRVSGGSDDHMGLFGGLSGSYLVPPNDFDKGNYSNSRLALEAIRSGQICPYGHPGGEEKLNIALLDYIVQLSMNMKDPGLIRLLTHKGSLQDKFGAFLTGNALLELQRHKFTSKFFKAFHESLRGKKPNIFASLVVSKDFKPLLRSIEGIAEVRKAEPPEMALEIQNHIDDIFTNTLDLSLNRLKKFLGENNRALGDVNTIKENIKKFELSLSMRNLYSNTQGDALLPKLLDSLSFPFLVSATLSASTFTASKVLFSSRKLLDKFSNEFDIKMNESRILWLTDTLFDSNGVSTVLKQTLNEIKRRDLNIDLLVCDDNHQSEDHLHVVKPRNEFEIPGFIEQPIRCPDLIQIKRIFEQGKYDKIICSTEMLMGPIALYLKHCYNVPTYMYMHTDWMEFAKSSIGLEGKSLSQFRRILRGFYKAFDGVFVLNESHRKWMIQSMGMDKDSVFKTAHWANDYFNTDSLVKKISKEKNEPFKLLYVGRLSKEKGIWDFIATAKELKILYPNLIVNIVGIGPEEEAIKKVLPQATYFGWIPKEELKIQYQSNDLLVLPSWFDTFGCVVLEALQCGLPVAAYSAKGPKEILKNQECGILVKSQEELSFEISKLIFDSSKLSELKKRAVIRSMDFKKENIMNQMLDDIKFH